MGVLMLRKALIASCVLACSATTMAKPIEINATDWLYVSSPSSGKLSTKDVWTALAPNTPTKSANSSGALISDFSFTNDFIFSGEFMPTYASNSGCLLAQDNSCNDNDIMGLVFGWQDEFNHYRLGWNQGGIADITGREGLFFIKEENGVSNTLMHWENVFWQEDQNYNFNIERTGSTLDLVLSGNMRNEEGTQNASQVEEANAPLSFQNISYSVNDNAFLSGKVGIYTESQTGVFSNLNADDKKTADKTATKIAEPTTLSALFLALIGLVHFQRRRN